MANFAMREALLAWVQRVNDLGEKRYVVLASDPATLDVCRENALPCAYDSHLQLQPGELRYGMTPEFLAMGKVRCASATRSGSSSWVMTCYFRSSMCFGWRIRLLT